jgi:hypothetical protein
VFPFECMLTFWKFCSKMGETIRGVIMSNEILFYVEESADGGYEACAVNHSIYTQCDDYSDLPDTLRDAVRCHFDDRTITL